MVQARAKSTQTGVGGDTLNMKGAWTGILRTKKKGELKLQREASRPRVQPEQRDREVKGC